MMRLGLMVLVVSLVSCVHDLGRREKDRTTYWHAWYEKGHKIGWLQTSVRRLAGGYEFERRGQLTTEMMGELTTVTPYSLVRTTSDFALREFESGMSAKGHDYRARGMVKNGHLVMTAGGKTQPQRVELDISGVVYPTDALPMLAIAKAWAVNTKHEVIAFDPMIQKSCRAEIVVLGTERINLRDTLRHAIKLSARLFEVPHMVWIDSTGAVLREESPPSSVTILEPPELAQAVSAGTSAPDLMTLFAVAPDRRLDNPRQIGYLKIELGGIDARALRLGDESQEIVSDSPVVVAISPARPPKTICPIPVKGETTATGPTLVVQSGSKEILRKAQELTTGAVTAEAAARRINDWVFRNVKQQGTPSIPSALDVLHWMAGDCNEHAVLYAALCRAIGIPCQICVGLVYRDGYFWYHAWNKVYVGGWVPVDPTFGQFPVDATHIKLVEGEIEEQARVLNVVGSLSIRVLEAR
ncbi:MAG: transglutaminase-like domain-containing protein [candidate division WOR-3 bacterium]